MRPNPTWPSPWWWTPSSSGSTRGPLDDESIRVAAAGARRLYRVWAALPTDGTLRLTWPLHESWLRLI